MKKVFGAILYISLIAPMLFGAFDVRALHKREISWCEFGTDVNVVDLGINIGIKQKLQAIKSGAKIETSPERDEIAGDAITVVARAYGTGPNPDPDPTHYPDYGQETQTGLSSIWSDINKEKDRFNDICSRSTTGVRKKSVIQTFIVAECEIGGSREALDSSDSSLDSFNLNGVQRFGINIEFMNLWIDSKKILGLKVPPPQYISNLPQTFAVFVRSYNGNTGVYSVEEGTVSSDSNNGLAIRHNADYLCELNSTKKTSVSVSPDPIGPPSPSPGGGSSLTGEPPTFGAGIIGSGGGGAGSGSGGDGAQIKEGCNVGRKVEFKEGNTTVSFENKFVGPVETPKWGAVCIINTANTIADWAFFILISVAFVLVVAAGFTWMTGRGDAEKQKKAAQMIGAALAGIVIALLARVLPAIITGILL